MICSIYQHERRQHGKVQHDALMEGATGNGVHGLIQESERFYFNLLTVNVSKTVYMTFSNYIDGLPSATDIKLNVSNYDSVRDCASTLLRSVRETNYLG